MNIRTFVVLAAGLLAAGCGSRTVKTADQSGEGDGLRAFPTVQVPGVYNNKGGREAYFVEHFWDAFFDGAEGLQCDSVTVCGVPGKEFEEAFSAYVLLLETQDIDIGKRSVDVLFDKVEACQKADTLSNAYSVFSYMMDHYLYDPNSPVRDEDLYQSYVYRLANSSLTDPDLVPAYAMDAILCARNAVKTKASDFTFKDAAGRSHRLYDIDADYILLFFSNPDCKACQDITGTFKGLPALNRMVTAGRLAVVSIYIDDDLAAWRRSLSEYPKSWYVGYDASKAIRGDLVYNIRGIPSLYVLDSDKLVVMKDAPEERVFSYLESISKDYIN